MALQQPERDGATKRIDHKINVSPGLDFASIDRTPEDYSRYTSPSFGKLGQEWTLCFRIDLSLGD